MEQIDAAISKNYSPLKFYLDDLERLDQVLADSCSAVTYETEGFRFTSVAELLASVKKARLETIHIKCEQPYVTIELGKLWARIYVSSSKDKSAGVFYRLDQILSGSQRSLS